MANNTTTSIWRHSAIAVAVGLCVASSAGYAQSNATGNIFGTVQAVAGTTVVVENTATGAKRTLTPDASGRFSATSLPTGTYKVTVLRNGAVVSTSDNVEVLIGQGSEAVFAAAAATQTVQVVGKVAKIDMSSSQTGATFTSKQLAALPIARNVDAIIQLAPNTTRADSRYTAGASFGGGAASENSYYINGFPVTNPLTQLGSSELPFGAIGQAQIQVGGFGAEFGRSTGGVVNITTKSGTNSWEAGVNFSVTPEALRSTRKDIYWPKTGANPTTDGKKYLSRADNESTSTTVGGYVGGPLIKDELFFFAAVDKLTTDSGTVVGTGGTATAENASKSSGWAQRNDVTNRYLTKFDWNITGDNRLELTLMGDRYGRNERLSGYDYTTRARNGVVVGEQDYTNNPDHNQGVGASTQILKYTGYLTDDLTLTVLTGKSKTPHPTSYAGYDPTKPQVSTLGSTFPGFTYNNLQAISGNVSDGSYREEVKANRVDVEYRLGNHQLRAGLDTVKLSSLNAGEKTAGGHSYVYESTIDPNLKPDGSTRIADTGALTALVDGQLTYFYVGDTIFSTIGNAYSDQSAQYIEDRWQVTKDLLVTAGLRNEQYKNRSGDGQSFLKVKDQITPRLAFSWNAMSDGSTKVFGSLGRYAVQIPTAIALRGANAATNYTQYYTYTGVAADGSPTGAATVGGKNSPNNELGQPKDLNSVSALNLKPNSQDELSLGIERSLSDSLTVGARVTYRRMNSVIDDYCDFRPFVAYANAKGLTDKDGNAFYLDTDGHSNVPWSCSTVNPGVANDFLISWKQDGNYEKVQLSKEAMGLPTAKRTYAALDLFAEHPLKDGWYGKVNYTYAKNKGNTEGQTNSDLGQIDIAATVAWDHGELMDGAYGYLPNDRRHQIKAYGFYQVTPELDIGGNLLLASGRPRSCLGKPDEAFWNTGAAYRSTAPYYHYCGGQLAPRGAAGTLPWDKRFDMSFTYRPQEIKGFAFRLDIFNLFNAQTVEVVQERSETTSGTPRNFAGRVISYTAPRSMKLTASYDMKF